MNEQLSESIKEAQSYLNQIEDMGEAALNIADRIITSCKIFLHDKQLDDFIAKMSHMEADVETKIKDAEKKIGGLHGAGTYMFHQVLANYIINARIEKTTILLNYLDKLNQDKL